MRRALQALLFDLLSVALWIVVMGPAVLAGGAVARLLAIALPWPVALVLSPLAFFAALLGLLAAAAVVSLLLPRCREGEYPFPDHGVAQAWAVRLLLHRIVGLPILARIYYGSPALRWLLLRALGAKVAFDMRASSDVEVLDPSLVEIGPGTMLGGGTWVSCHTIDEGKIVLKKTRIGANVNVFIRSVIFPGATIEDEVTLGIETIVATDASVGEGTYVGMQCMIGPRVKIGRGAVIGHRVLINEGATIGDHAVIETGAIVAKGAAIAEGERVVARTSSRSSR